MVIASVRTFSSVARLAVMMAIVPDSNRTWTLATSVTGECTAAPWAASRRGGESTRPSTMSMSWIMRSITTVSFCTRDANGPSRRDSMRMGARTICRSSSTAPLNRSTWPTCRTAPVRSATAKSARASSSVGVIGFSTSTLTPASSRSRATAKCSPVGTATLATSTRPTSARWSAKTCVSYCLATAAARAASVSTTPTSSTSGSSAYTSTWYWPMWPVPTTPARTFAPDVGRYVGRELRQPPDVRVGADARERHHAGEAADRRAVADLAVAGEARVVDDDHAVADPTVVRDVAQAHHQALATDVRPTLRARGAVHGHVLADDGVGAHAHARGRAGLVLEVLGHAAEHAAVADLHARAERHAALEHGVVADLDATLQRHLGADHAEGADPHPGLEPRARIDDRRGMDRVTHRAPPLRPSGPPPRASTARSSARTRCSSSGRRDSAAKIRRASIAGRAGVPR